MFKKHALLSNTDNAASLSKRKLIVFFILGCMMVNGFAPNKGEEKKYSLIMLFADISQNAAVQLLGECGNSIMSVASKICTDIMKKMMPYGKQPVNSSKESKKQENRSNDYAVIINSSASENKQAILREDENKSWNALFFTPEKMFKCYNGCKSGLEEVSSLVLLFLIFVVAIRQRKGWEEAAISINKIEKKTRISA